MRPCIFVIGTRAQLVKVAPVLHAASGSGLPYTVWLVGQHRDSMEDLISDFRLQAEITAKTLLREHSSVGGLLRWAPVALRDCQRYIRRVHRREGKVPLVIVHGDTLSTLIGAIAGKLAGAEIVHLESGLSSENLLDPFPEEILRRLTFRLTRYALCPNARASSRMRALGTCEVVDTGDNTLLDCVRFALTENSEPTPSPAGPYFVASIHRFGNIYRTAELTGILDEILDVSELGRVHFVLHPPTERRLRKSGLLDRLRAAPGVELRPRMPFTRFVALLACARGVFSDGGSNQEELSYLGVPAVLFRDRSERPDGLGGNIVFRKQIGERLSRFVSSGRFDELRQPCRLDDGKQPSRTAIDALLGWAAGAAP